MDCGVQSRTSCQSPLFPSIARITLKRGKVPFNPCLGMDKAHEADPNANREWFPDEWKFVRESAPMKS